MVILPQTMEDAEYADDMCANCLDKGFFDSPSLSDDIWKKFDLDTDSSPKIEDSSYPTPPSSPHHEFCSDTEDVLKNNLHKIDDDSLSRTIIGITVDLDNIQCNLIQDCMWSAPGLVAAGLLPGESVKPKAGSTVSAASSEPTLDENSNNISPTTSCAKKLNQLDINTKDCVDPAAVFPCSSRNNSPSPSISALSQSQDSSYDLGLDTPSASSDNDSDDEEIDVVNVQTDIRQHPAIRRHHSHPASLGSASQRPNTLSLTIRRERGSEPLSTLPAATSMSAQVAAMHNYSSSSAASSTSSSSSGSHHHHKSSPSYKSYHSYSSPQTPLSASSSTSSHHKRLRPYSSPASPQTSSSSSSKRQKMVSSESDLKSVVRKLTGRRSQNQHSSHHHHHHSSSSNHNSRSSSDYEDNSDIGKRAYHNVLERKRRDDLRTSFHLLRERVPEIEANERAPKMMILNKSTEYITELTQTHQNLMCELQRQKQQHEQLKRKLTLLRKEAL